MKPGDKKQDQQQELIPLAVGEFLKHHRLEKKLTLATIAEAVKLDDTAPQHYKICAGHDQGTVYDSRKDIQDGEFVPPQT